MKYLLALIPLLISCVSDNPHSQAAHGRKVMGLQEKFDRFDYNADGELTRAEIEQGIRESGTVGITEEELDLAMKEYDVNDNGAISRWETERAIDSPLPENAEGH